jgi:hypothetical protein
MPITESSITLNFPDNNYFRLGDCEGYKILQNHFAEMDVCWYDSTKDILYLIELKNWGNNRLVEESRNFFKGWRCNVNESIFISPTGTMKAASCGQGPILGNVFSTFDIKSQAVICQKDYCHCGTDILITKEK